MSPQNFPSLLGVKSAPRVQPLFSVDIQREAFEVGERAVGKRTLVGGPQHYARRLAAFEGLLPARRAQAPPISGLQARKAKFRDRSREIVAAGFREGEKSRSEYRTDGMAADIFATRVAASVTKEAGHRFQRTDLEPLAKHIEPIPAAAPATFVVPQHNLFAHGVYDTPTPFPLIIRARLDAVRRTAW